MYEGMITDHAMIVLVDEQMWHMPDDAYQLLERRAQVAQTSIDFILKIDYTLSSIHQSIQPNYNRDYWKRYCVPRDEMSAILAAEKIHEIIQMWNKDRIS